jgi:hypothetical protein
LWVIERLAGRVPYTYDDNGNQLTQTTTLTTPGGVRTLVTATTYDASGRPLPVSPSLPLITSQRTGK